LAVVSGPVVASGDEPDGQEAEQEGEDGEALHGLSGKVTVGAGVQLEGKSRRACR
jgi:hypothetical protein